MKLSRSLLRPFFILIAPLYNKLLCLVAEGPWGTSAHGFLIRIFSGLFGIPKVNGRKFKKLGDFFLRDQDLHIEGAELVSPAESLCLEGPAPVRNESVSIKGIDYAWNDLPEFKDRDLGSASFWNLYLAPYHYHWVHCPADLDEVEVRRFSGRFFPVNGLGRFLSPRLYLENERLSFRGVHPRLGRIDILCVGAMGVSRIASPWGPFSEGQWTRLSRPLRKGEKIAGFRLGSSVLLVCEKTQSFQTPDRNLRVGNRLI